MTLTPSSHHTRILKIEEDGDSWLGKTKPKIRLKGNWLARAGFNHGQRVEVKFIAIGVIELRVTVNPCPAASLPTASSPS